MAILILHEGDEIAFRGKVYRFAGWATSTVPNDGIFGRRRETITSFLVVESEGLKFDELGHHDTPSCRTRPAAVRAYTPDAIDHVEMSDGTIEHAVRFSSRPVAPDPEPQQRRCG